jgi:murein DD-endopeptidase MepM/ murein hydrolase activator NlpD
MTREQLASRRARRRVQQRRRNRRVLMSLAVPAAVVGLIFAALWILTGASNTDDAATTTDPAPVSALGPGARPPDVPIAQAGLVDLRLPVDPERVTAIAFHATENPAAVELSPRGPITHHDAPRDGRAGPLRAAVDVGAPAGTLVYSPVDGQVTGRSDFVVRGQVQGYQVVITPPSSTGEAVVVTHVEPHPGTPTPRVGQAVRAGITALGQVRDMGGVMEQEISRYTGDSGNHVTIEVVRTGRD